MSFDTPGFGPGYGFGIYVHWPYCSRICPYCDFNVYTAKTRDSSQLVQAMMTDIEGHRRWLTQHPRPDTLYFGGGTPSLLAPGDLKQLIDCVRTHFGEPKAGITLEANPNEITPERLAEWHGIGVSRLSIGVQSLESEALQFLGRDHSENQAKVAVSRALKVFDDVSIDLIYARPGQVQEEWALELQDALALGAPHLSLYELTIAERTVFWNQMRRGALVPMGDDEQADLYELTQHICEGAGLPAYEISNHAKASSFESVHNHIYWGGGDWLGIGPGAHGRVSVGGARFETSAVKRPEAYVAELSQDKRGHDLLKLDNLDIARELLSMGLRSNRGFSTTRLSSLGVKIDSEAEAHLIETAAVHRIKDKLVLTPKGRLLADYVAGALAPEIRT